MLLLATDAFTCCCWFMFAVAGFMLTAGCAYYCSLSSWVVVLILLATAAFTCCLCFY